MKDDIFLTVFLRIRCSVQKWQRERPPRKNHSCILPIPKPKRKAACTCHLLYDPIAARIIHSDCLKNNPIFTKMMEVRTNRLNRRKEGKNCCEHQELYDWRLINKEEMQTRRLKE